MKIRKKEAISPVTSCQRNQNKLDVQFVSCADLNFIILVGMSFVNPGMYLKFLTGGNLAMIGGYLGRRPTLACLWHTIPRFEGVNK